MEGEFIIDFEFYKDGQPVYWVQTGFVFDHSNSDKEETSGTIFDMLITWASNNYPNEGQPRITNIWKF